MHVGTYQSLVSHMFFTWFGSLYSGAFCTTSKFTLQTLRGFDMQCAANIRCWIASRTDIMVRSPLDPILQSRVTMPAL
jgi:hypothetical protein